MTRGRLATAFFSLVCLAGLLGASRVFPAAAAVRAAAPIAGGNRAAGIEALPDEDRRWLTELVAPIILPEEEAVYLDLADADLRARFREAFWVRREAKDLPFPLGPGYRGRYERLRALADSTFDGVREDAGRMVIRNGEPSSIDTLESCRMSFRDLEIWTYAGRQSQGTRRYFFYRIAPNTPRKLFRYGTPDSELLSPGSCRKLMGDLGKACVRDTRRAPDPCALSDCAETCRVWELYTEIRTLQASASGGESESARLLEAPRVSTEDLSTFRRASGGSRPSGFTLAAAAVSPTPTPAAAAPAPTAPPAAAASSSRVPSGQTPKLSSKEKAARIRELSDDDRQWMTEYVAPIILPEEENLFLQLPAGYPRAMFREEFWKRRERDGMPEPFGPGYRTRYEHLLELADSDYDGRFGEAGRLVVRRGEPSFIQEFKDCSEVFRQAEIWTYRPKGSTGRELHFLFYRSSFGAPRKLWYPGDNEIFQTASCVASFDMACGATGRSQPGSGSQCIGAMSVAKGCDSACYVARIADEIRGRGTASVAAEAAFAPGVSTEGIDSLWQRLASSSDPAAKQIGVEGPSSPSSALSTGPRAAAIPEPTPASWDAASIRDRIIALPKKYRDFLDVAAPIMADAELVAFLQAKPSERDAFIRKFWRQHGKKG